MSIKKLLYVLTMGVCLLTACNKSKTNSVEDELINKVKTENPDCTCDPYIKKYEWKGRTVYVQAVAGPACSSIPFFYNSSGERFELPSGITYEEFFAEATFLKDVWTCRGPVYTSFEQELISKTQAENPNCICDPFINKYNYKGNIVYMKSIKGPACNGIPIFYGENGEHFDLPQGMTFAEFVAQCVFIKEVWSCKEKLATHQ